MSATFANASDDSPVSPLGGPWEAQSDTNYTGRSSFASPSPFNTQGSTGSSPNRSFSFDLTGSPLVSPRTSFGSRDGTDGMSHEGSLQSPMYGYTCSASQYNTDNEPMSPVLYDLSHFDPISLISIHMPRRNHWTMCRSTRSIQAIPLLGLFRLIALRHASPEEDQYLPTNPAGLPARRLNVSDRTRIHRPSNTRMILPSILSTSTGKSTQTLTPIQRVSDRVLSQALPGMFGEKVRPCSPMRPG